MTPYEPTGDDGVFEEQVNMLGKYLEAEFLDELEPGELYVGAAIRLLKKFKSPEEVENET